MRKREFHSVEETRTLLGVSRSTVYELMGSGDLASVKIGRRRLVERASLESLLVRRAVMHAPPALELGLALGGDRSVLPRIRRGVREYREPWQRTVARAIVAIERGGRPVSAHAVNEVLATEAARGGKHDGPVAAIAVQVVNALETSEAEGGQA